MTPDRGARLRRFLRAVVAVHQPRTPLERVHVHAPLVVEFDGGDRGIADPEDLKET